MSEEELHQALAPDRRPLCDRQQRTVAVVEVGKVGVGLGDQAVENPVGLDLVALETLGFCLVDSFADLKFPQVLLADLHRRLLTVPGADCSLGGV